jgi:hypothetical protein
MLFIFSLAPLCHALSCCQPLTPPWNLVVNHVSYKGYCRFVIHATSGILAAISLAIFTSVPISLPIHVPTATGEFTLHTS